MNHEIKFVFADTLRPGDHVLDSEGQELAIKSIETAPNGRLEFTVRYVETGFYADRDYIVSKTPKTRVNLITAETPDETAALPEPENDLPEPGPIDQRTARELLAALKAMVSATGPYDTGLPVVQSRAAIAKAENTGK